MKKTLIIVLALSLVLAGIAVATVVSSKHDMRANVTVSGRTISSAGSTTSQVCVFCHHPHRGTNALVTSVLLWNISDGGNSYATYDSPETNIVTINGSDVTDATSLLCMGCHDGGANNAYIQKTADGTLGAVPLFAGSSDAANLGTTLADDHPIEFTYPTAWAAGLDDIQLGDGTIVTGAGGQSYPLFSGTMQCATCHAVHDPGTAGVQFMRGPIADSEICIDCHTAK
jgi:hypothetical protein